MTTPRRIANWCELDLRGGGRSLIEASAGTGKTWTIAVLYLRLLLEGDVPLTPRQIVVSTFSDAAAQELRDRLRSRLIWADTFFERWLQRPDSDASDPAAQWLSHRWQATETAQRDRLRLRLAQEELDLAPIGTLHSLCRRILADFPLESGSSFAAGDIVADGSVLDALVDDLWRDLMQGDEALDSGDRFWIAAGRMTLRARMRLIMAPGVGVRTETAPADATPLWSRAVASARAIISTPQRFKYSSPTQTSKLLQALRQLVESADADTLDAFDVETVCEHEAKLDSQFRSGQLDVGDLREMLTALFADLHACAQSETAGRVAALERYRVKLMERRRAQLLRDAQTTFDLLIENAAAALSVPNSTLAARLRAQWPVALVDEFQDTDVVQYRVLDTIYRDADSRRAGRLVMIGDPKQAIYRFRGGDINTYLAAAASADEVLTLSMNRRSSAAYVAALNEWYAAVGDTLSTSQGHPIRYEPVDAAGRGEAFGGADGVPYPRPLVVQYCADVPDGAGERREVALQACARQIVALLGSGARIGDKRLQPGDIAVLLPKNDQIGRLRELLRERGVPCVGAGKSSVFDANLVPDLQIVLHAVVHTNDDTALRAALATRFGGKTLAELDALRDDAEAWQKHRMRFFAWHREWQRHGVLAVVLALSVDLAVQLPDLAERERALTDLRHLGELLQTQSELTSGAEQLLAWLAQQCDGSAGEVATDERQLRLESDARRVRLMTLHASKGLEFPLVMLPLMWDHAGRKSDVPVLHDPLSHQRFAELSDRGGKAAARAGQEDQDERFRVFYVALTRAQHACYVYALPPDRRRDANSTRPAVDPERSALDATLSRLPQTGAALEARAPHVRWRSDEWSWPDDVYRPDDAAATPLAARREPAWPVLEHTYSFTALVAARRGDREESAADDENAARDAALAELPEAATERVADPRIAALSVLRGADFGNAVHAVFERREPDRALAAQFGLIGAGLRDYAVKVPSGFDAVTAVAEIIERTLAVPLFGAMSLGAIDPSRQCAEMAFQFVLDAVTPQALREACARHGAAGLLPAELPSATLSGLMSGKIDLIVEHDGRFHVLDYKTNYLGDALADYAPARLAEAMDEHRYGFQALLYTVALDRYLRQRLPRYSRARHLGGAIYLFVRACGLAPEAGIWRHRFDDALIDAVDTALGAHA